LRAGGPAYACPDRKSVCSSDLYFGADNLIVLATNADGTQEYKKVDPYDVPATNH